MQRSLRWTDPSYRGLLPSVHVSMCVIRLNNSPQHKQKRSDVYGTPSLYLKLGGNRNVPVNHAVIQLVVVSVCDFIDYLNICRK